MERFKLLVNEYLEGINSGLVAFSALIMTVLSPIMGAIIILLISAVFNFALGLRESVKIQKREFSLSRAFEAIWQLVVVCLFIIISYELFETFGRDETANIVVEYGTYIVTYFYITNAARNASLLWPNVKMFSFIYQVLSTKIFDELKDKVGLNKKTEDK
jgi:cellobiose-specific phosphotransferase system component IIC